MLKYKAAWVDLFISIKLNDSLKALFEKMTSLDYRDQISH